MLRLRPLLPAAVCLALVLAAAVPGIIATAQLRWPYDLDLFRDVAAAQALRDGAWGTDPFYAHEAGWYNPLIPAVIAFLSSVSQAAIPEVAARSGAWLNILGPLAFFACAARIAGSEPAVFATVAFLFLPINPPPWAPGTYTPWLFPAATAQVFLYAGLLAIVRLLERPSIPRSVGVGALIGVAFLAHTAPALLLAAVLTLSSLAYVDHETRRAWRDRLAPIGVAAVTSLLVAAPFLGPLLVRYHLRVENRAPATWLYTPGSRVILAALANPLVSLFVALCAIGAFALMRRHTRRETTVLGAWGVAALLLSGYSLAAQGSSWLPPLVPAYHFLFQLLAWACVLAGAGVWSAVSRMGRIGGLRRWPEPAMLALTAIILTAALYPTYLKRHSLTDAARAARQFGVSGERTMTQWIRTSTPKDAVFLASDGDAQQVIAPAGRHVVCVDPFFSNPYISHAARAAARNRMFSAIDAGDWSAFDQLARAYDVSYIAARGQRAALLLSSRRVDLGFGGGDLYLFRVRPPR